MFCEPCFALSSSHKAQMDPHWLLNSRFADLHGKRIRQICRPIFPCPERWSCVLRMDRPSADPERRSATLPTRPSLPKQGASCTLTLSLACITHPEQLNHGVSKGKTAAGRTLTGVLIWRSLVQAELNKFFSLGSASSGTDEQMVQLYLHA